jgi:cytochrome P450
MLTIIALVGALLAFTGYHLINTFLEDRRAAAEAKRRGCADVPLHSTGWPFGIPHLRRMLQADKEKAFPDLIMRTYQDIGVYTYRNKVLGSPNYFTIDPKNIQAILATQFHDFELGPRRKNVLAPLLGVGIFTQDGKGWEHSRAMMRPQFARDQVSDLDLEERHVQNMMRALSVDSKGWTDTIDLQVLFFRLTLDSATEFLFGESVESQLTELSAGSHLTDGKVSFQQDKGFATAFDVAQRYLAMRLRFGNLYWLINPKEFRTACKRSHEFVDHFVRLALSGEQHHKKIGSEKGGKERYVFLEALAAETRDPIELRSQLFNILLAGRDTTASMLGWLFYILARHPAVFQKLRETIISEFGTYDDPREITFARLKNCQYLQQCNNETLRLYPVVPGNARMAVRDTTLPSGGGPDGKSPVFIRKGIPVIYSVHAMHHRKDIWGDDADEFKPERWQGMKHTWNYLPFNGGPRICLGQQFALTEVSYVAVRLLQRFDQIENMETDPIVRHDLTLINCSANGVKVRLHEAR